jgi:isoamylase
MLMSRHASSGRNAVLQTAIAGCTSPERLPSDGEWCTPRGVAESLLPFQPGHVFAGHYRVERLLARGGHGTVFVAEHLPTERLVALKLLWPHLLTSPDDANCLELEAKVAGRVNSEYIVRVLDAGVDAATYTPYLAMELLDGRSLLQLVEEDGPLPLARALLYLSHAAQGLDRAHGFVDKAGHHTPIVHRDLKPENLFLTRRENGEAIVKILDFGVAKVVSGSVTTTGSIRGTPAYMAIEQITGAAIGPATDVWAFGLVAFYLLTGRNYWLTAARSDLGLMSLFAEVLHQETVAPSSRACELGVTPRWSSGFDDWFLRCLARDPDARFQTVGEAFSALSRAVLEGEPAAECPWPLAAAPRAGSEASSTRRRIRPEISRGSLGHHVAPGARLVGEGATFALFSQHATGVELCLFDAPHADGETRLSMTDCVNHVWRIHVPGVRAGQLYGFRVHGPWAPELGHRFNPNKLLLDPYAKKLSGALTWHPAIFGHEVDAEDADLSASTLDSAPFVPKSELISPEFDWGDDEPPNVPWGDTLIYEAHVRGMTMRHPDVPANLRGTYLGFASDPILEHLRDLGVTAVELMPIYHSLREGHLDRQGLTNYWGYNPVAFFAPDARYATAGGDPVFELKTMVKALHAAGMEVLLDVVYNHTAEGDHVGPTLSLRGIDNSCYYRLAPGQRRFYEDLTGCGNSLALLHPRALQLVLDSLRYWAVEMRVDGFRFDLLPALARDGREFDGFSRFLAAVQQDPALGKLKLIAEPWDLGPNGYQLGAFPPGWSEWNACYRDSVRRFWRGDSAQALELTRRVGGSSDIFGPSGRGCHASINFVTCHDGFTLQDLVSFDAKANLANGHDGCDGPRENFSSSWGEEGPSSKPEILTARARTKRNFIASLAFSRGVPMLSHGDELGRSLDGNNNAYCHDTELNWLNWVLAPADLEFFEFTCEVLRIAREYRALREPRHAGQGAGQDGVWVDAGGHESSASSLADPELRSLALLLGATTSPADWGLPGNEPLFLVMNAGEGTQAFVLPVLAASGSWHSLIDTTQASPRALVTTTPLEVPAHSLQLLRYVV